MRNGEYPIDVASVVLHRGKGEHRTPSAGHEWDEGEDFEI